MALLINEACTLCDACVPVCPNEAIKAGDPVYIIDPLKCTECVGAKDEPQCKLVCPSDCIVQHPDFVETPLDEARRRGVRLLDVPSLGREVALVSDLAALRGLLGIIRHERPAIVHTHTSKAGFVGRLAARIAGGPAVIHQPP